MKKTEYKLMDSSAWLSYFFAASSAVKKVVDSETILYTSVISLFEIKRKLLRESYDKNVEAVLYYIKNRSIIITLDEVISQQAADISIKYKLHVMDALIYATAKIINAELVTFDHDFKNLEHVIVL